MQGFWFWFLCFVPIVGWIALLIFYVQEGTKGSNDLGLEPL
ncbi:DUF805 domain-containing protein [Campylobacter curvus]